MTQKDKATKLLFICTGNTCRSPMAQGICRKLAQEKSLNIIADSAGLDTYTGNSISQNSIDACKEIGIDISDYKSTSIDDVDLDSYDKIYVMSYTHKMRLRTMGIPSDKIVILSEETGGVSDPYGRNLDYYRKCRDEIYTEVENALKEL